ncbi:MAG: hypothetical protein M0R06_11410 [Sphaerochaeta sp.]|jgi:hypothetical protein|nr:hypothetical protein [Sphaerochaeta sp.]
MSNSLKVTISAIIIILIIACAGLGYFSINTNNNLNITQSILLDTQNQLATTQENLVNTQEQLATTQTQLTTAQNQLTQTQSQLADANQQISAITNLPSPIITVGVYHSDGTELVDTEDRDIVLIGSSEAINPTYNELMEFLQNDNTHEQVYIDPSFTCANFAEMLYYNATKSNIKAGFVSIHYSSRIFSWDSSCSCVSEGFHACNVFDTTDKGLVFIDSTGTVLGDSEPKIVDVSVGQSYQPISLFSDIEWCPLGSIYSYKIIW